MKTLAACLLASTLALSAAAADPQRKLVMQVSEGVDQGEYAINIANNLLKSEPGAAIQIVAYSKGVDFLTDGFRGKPKEVKELQDRGVVFKVCNNTLRQRDIDRSHLLPDTQIVPYGAIEIARLQQYEGYSYIKP
ncbi:MAG TPA: DsrE family protein [Usitatibacter sp.]|nr:DsrE family protein [Usitatibacter sp.]